jgi:ABC-type lipopolysaccharide export system ATPase subunit
MIYADSIRLSFGGAELLNDVSLRLLSPGVTGLLGLNGCGKTSLLRILYGDLRAQYAYLCIDGVRQNRPLCKTPGLINMSSQIGAIPTMFSVDQLIRLHGLRPEAFWSVHREYREVIETGLRADSHSKRRLLEILILLEMPTRYTFLDEPFAGAAPILVDYIQRTILRRGQQKGILLTDHNYRSVKQVTNRIYLLGGGTLEEL